MNVDSLPEQRVAVIGGGIAGLAAAYSLLKQARQTGQRLAITLIESSPRLGGKILSEQVTGPDGDCNYLIEGGPDSFLLQKPWAAQLAQELGLESELIGTNPRPKKLYVVNRGRLTPMPDGVMLIIPTRFMPFVTSRLISWPGKIRMGMDLFIPRRKGDADESMGDFIRRRLGREALEKIAEPLLSGIHVSDPEQQSLLGTFPRFRNIEKQHGSLIRGMLAQRGAAAKKKPAAPPASGWKASVFVSLRGGMAQLVTALENALEDADSKESVGSKEPAASLEPVEIWTNSQVTQIQPRETGRYTLTTADGSILNVDAVVLATPAFISADLVAQFAPELAQALATIRYVSTATVSLAFPRSALAGKLDGIGFIVPRGENRRISACTMSSLKFKHRAPDDQVLLRCFVGGPGKEALVDLSDAEMIAMVRAELADLLKLQAEPSLARVYRWIKGNAQYDVGHLERVRQMHALAARFPGLFLTGSAYEGIGVPDCIHQGQQAAENVFAYLQGEKLAQTRGPHSR